MLLLDALRERANSYRKLGLRSRAELVRRVAGLN
jgi:DNA-binding CsgD family transcriptional regulator